MIVSELMYRALGKRLLDITLSLIALVVLSPLLLVTAIVIRLEDGGPAIFRQRRIGRDGIEFTLFKYRGMPEHVVEVESALAPNLPTTRVGSTIRRTNIDELPQLFNVLKGDMSLVGPRPALPSQDDVIRLRQETGAIRLRPGLTGLAQINAYVGMPPAEKAAWDAQYAARISLIRDVAIISRTFRYLLKPPPAY